MQVLTLTKHRGHHRPDDEQLHVLPLCVPDSTDEFGNAEAQRRKVVDGSIECLQSFPMTTRLHRQPVMCKRKRLKMAAMARAAAGVVSRRGRGRGKTSLCLAAANALRVATHCRTTSTGRGRGLKHPCRVLTKLPGVPCAANWIQATMPGLSHHQARATSFEGNTIKICTGDFNQAHNGILPYTVPIPTASPANKSVSQTASHPPPSYNSLFHTNSAEAMSTHDAGSKSSISGGWQRGLLHGSTYLPPAYSYGLTSQASENRCGKYTILHGNSRELPSYRSQFAANSTVKQEVQQHNSSIQQQRFYIRPVIPAFAQLPGFASGWLPHGNIVLPSTIPHSTQSPSGLCHSMPASLATTLSPEGQSVSGNTTPGSHTSAYGSTGDSKSSSGAACQTELLTNTAATESQVPAVNKDSDRPSGNLLDISDRLAGNLLDISKWLGTNETPAANSSLGVPAAGNQTCIRSVPLEERNWRFPLEMLSDVAHYRPKLPEIGSVIHQRSVDGVSPANVHLSNLLSYQHSVEADADNSIRPMPLHQLPAQPMSVEVDKVAVEESAPLEIFCDNMENFRDSKIGGVALALTHGSILFEVAKRELHATTALKNPNRSQPTRISLVFYQHRNLNMANHGRRQFEQRAADQRQAQSDGANIGTSLIPNSEPGCMTIDQHLLQDGTGADNSRTQTPLSSGGLFLANTAAIDNNHGHAELSVNRHLLQKSLSMADLSNAGTEAVKISTHVPTSDELAEVDLGEQ